MVTLKEIAESASVTPTLVSHVLRNRLGHVRVSEGKRKQILKTAEQLGYVPNLRARSLASKKSFSLGVIMLPQEHGHWDGKNYFCDLLMGVDQACQSAGYHCQFASYQLHDPEQFVWPRFMRDSSVDGVVLAGYTHPKVVEQLASRGLPCVQIGSNVDPVFGVDCAYGDVDAALHQMARHLFQRGHRRIQLILPDGPGPKALADNFRRLSVLIDGLETQVALMPSEIAKPDIARAYAQSIVSEVNRPTALISQADYCDELVDVFWSKGLQCPKDFSLVAIGSSEMANHRLVPSGAQLSTIVIPGRQAGYLAVKRLLTRLDVIPKEEQVTDSDLAIPCEILFRESCETVVNA